MIVCNTFIEKDPWVLRITGKTADGRTYDQTLTIQKPARVLVEQEFHQHLPVYNGQFWYADGNTLLELEASGMAVCGQLIPESVSVETKDCVPLTRGVDYQLEPEWAKIGRLKGSMLGEKDSVFVCYEYDPLMVDSIMLGKDGSVYQKRGIPMRACPLPPVPEDGEICLANIYFHGHPGRLTGDMIFPVTEPACPDLNLTMAEEYLPCTWKKLMNGEKVRYLAWGDSVTLSAYRPRALRWPGRFAASLQKKFPQASIETIVSAWGGHKTKDFMEQPSGSRWNYQETVLDTGADFATLEFTNDATFLNTQEDFDRYYKKILKDFRERGIELILIVPHYTRPDWMGFTSEKNCDEDSRPYTKFLREFAAKEHIALVDVARRFGHLWREGIPFNTLMMNGINHPDERGFQIYLDELNKIFCNCSEPPMKSFLK